MSKFNRNPTDPKVLTAPPSTILNVTSSTDSKRKSSHNNGVLSRIKQRFSHNKNSYHIPPPTQLSSSPSPAASTPANLTKKHKSRVFNRKHKRSSSMDKEVMSSLATDDETPGSSQKHQQRQFTAMNFQSHPPFAQLSPQSDATPSPIPALPLFQFAAATTKSCDDVQLCDGDDDGGGDDGGLEDRFATAKSFPVEFHEVLWQALKDTEILHERHKFIPYVTTAAAITSSSSLSASSSSDVAGNPQTCSCNPDYCDICGEIILFDDIYCCQGCFVKLHKKCIAACQIECAPESLHPSSAATATLMSRHGQNDEDTNFSLLSNALKHRNSTGGDRLSGINNGGYDFSSHDTGTIRRHRVTVYREDSITSSSSAAAATTSSTSSSATQGGGATSSSNSCGTPTMPINPDNPGEPSRKFFADTFRNNMLHREASERTPPNWSLEQLSQLVSVFNRNEEGLELQLSHRRRCAGTIRIAMNLLRPIRIRLGQHNSVVQIADTISEEEEEEAAHELYGEYEEEDDCVQNEQDVIRLISLEGGGDGDGNGDDYYEDNQSSGFPGVRRRRRRPRSGAVMRKARISSVSSNSSNLSSRASSVIGVIPGDAGEAGEVREAGEKREKSIHQCGVQTVQRKSLQNQLFWLPKGTSKCIYIDLFTTADQVILAILSKYQIADNPRKFALYEHTVMREKEVRVRKLLDRERPLQLVLMWAREGESTFLQMMRAKRFVLQENDAGGIEWEHFSKPELKNFLRMIQDEEETERDRVTEEFRLRRIEINRLLSVKRDGSGKEPSER